MSFPSTLSFRWELGWFIIGRAVDFRYETIRDEDYRRLVQVRICFTPPNSRPVHAEQYEADQTSVSAYLYSGYWGNPPDNAFSFPSALIMSPKSMRPYKLTCPHSSQKVNAVQVVAYLWGDATECRFWFDPGYFPNISGSPLAVSIQTDPTRAQECIQDFGRGVLVLAEQKIAAWQRGFMNSQGRGVYIDPGPANPPPKPKRRIISLED